MKVILVMEIETDRFHVEDPETDEMVQLSQRTAKAMIKEHAKDAVEAWGGQLWPGHILRDLKVTGIRHMKVD